MQYLDRKTVAELVDADDLIARISQGFIDYSNGLVLTPPVGSMEFDSPPGDVHIKYGYQDNQAHYVIKIASGFYENPKLGKASSNGMMLVFSRQTGELEIVLHDEGYLTDIRTAAAGSLCARLFAPEEVRRIGIFGSGTQARLQLSHLANVTDCRRVTVFGRNHEAVSSFKDDFEKQGYEVEVAGSPSELTGQCNLIVTTTTSREPLFSARDIKPGTHITAVGADTPGKQELDAGIFENADWVIADSVKQCTERGECASGLRLGKLDAKNILEIGNLISGDAFQRKPTDISIADLTGVAVQDIQVATAVYENYMKTVW